MQLSLDKLAVQLLAVEEVSQLLHNVSEPAVNRGRDAPWYAQ